MNAAPRSLAHKHDRPCGLCLLKRGRGNLFPVAIHLTNKQYQELLELKDAEEFSLNYKTFLGKVIKVTDGDTLRAAVWLNNAPTKFIFRLGGIDTP